MSDKPNPFVWYELMTTDIDAAERFYRDVVGWTAQDSGMTGMRYTLMHAGEHRIAGVMGLPQALRDMGRKPVWLGYIGVADVDAAAARLVASGGQLHRDPEDIPGVGRFAPVSDPQGAGFMLFQPLDASQAAPAMSGPGTIGWHELYAADGAAAFDFYADQFGWTKGAAFEMGPMGTYRLFATGGPDVGGIMTKPPAVPVPSWNLYVRVPDIDAAAARVVAGGGQVLHGPMEVPGGDWILQGLDPQGASFALTAPPR